METTRDTMEHTIYDPPKAKLDDANDEESYEFYVVGTTKFAVLFLATFGVYSVYWFYRNWKLYKIRNNEDIYPVMRGIFSIFFAHTLFEYINVAIENKSLTHRWSPGLLATLYILFAIAGGVLDRFSGKEVGSPYTDVGSFFTMFITCFILVKVQTAINLSQGVQNSSVNSKFTLANYLWCLPGLVLWVFAIVGLAMIFGLVEL